MNVGIFGPGHYRRTEYANFSHVSSTLDEYSNIRRIISGGGKGVESLALRYAALKGIAAESIPPNIKAHGTENGFIFRNKDIIEQVELVILFWDGNRMYHQLMHDTIARGKILHVFPVE